MKRSSQKGVTLIELLVVVGVLSTLVVTQMQLRVADLEEISAKKLGKEIALYNQAVRTWLLTAPASLDPQTGSAWLKSVECGGLSPVSLVGCNFPDRPAFGNVQFNTQFSVLSGGLINASTSLGALTVGGKPRADLAALAVASAMAAMNEDNLGGATQYGFNVNRQTAEISFFAQNQTLGDQWLRIDGGNSMMADINFSTTDALGNPASRNITNAATVTAQSLVDATNSQFSIVPSQTSTLNTLTSSRIIDRDDPNFSLDPSNLSVVKDTINEKAISQEYLATPIIYDLDPANPNQPLANFYLDPNSTSRINQLRNLENLYLGDENTNPTRPSGERSGDIRMGTFAQGAWASDFMSNIIFNNIYYRVPHNGVILKPSCPAGGIAHAVVTPHTTFFQAAGGSGGLLGNLLASLSSLTVAQTLYTEDLGDRWRIKSESYSNNALLGLISLGGLNLDLKASAANLSNVQVVCLLPYQRLIP